MNTNGFLRSSILSLRETSKLTQTELAKRLPFTASRLSRIESGDMKLNADDAIEICNAIDSDDSKSFAKYLQKDWRELSRPPFKHPNLDLLWQAEVALQKLKDLENDPDVKNVFVKQIASCELSLREAAEFLVETEHPIAFVGPVSVGKTTTICDLADLRDTSFETLERQMALQTSAGRTTIGEVHVQNGSEFNVFVEPASHEEILMYAELFAVLLAEKVGRINASSEGPTLSSEISRAIQNMTGLIIRRVKGEDNKYQNCGPGMDLATSHNSEKDDSVLIEKLKIEIVSQMNLPARQRTSISYSQNRDDDALNWLYETTKAINCGLHSEFSLPKKMVVSVPHNLLGSDELSVRLIDTRGIDEVSAPRRDLQSYVDDERTIVVFCTKFGDAPNDAVEALIEKAVDSGSKESILLRGLLMVFPQNDEESKVLDTESSEPVGDRDMGREIRKDQINSTNFSRMGIGGFPIEFHDVSDSNELASSKSLLVSRIQQVREGKATRVNELIRTVDELIKNRKDLEKQAAFDAAASQLRVWLNGNKSLSLGRPRIEKQLLSDIRGVRYASSLRASINRCGSWDKFDYWDGLGEGCRKEVVKACQNAITEFVGLLKTTIDNSDFDVAKPFMEHVKSLFHEREKALYIVMGNFGVSAYRDQLGKDYDYWAQSQSRWGENAVRGTKYKDDIYDWTSDWFESEARNDRREFVETEIQKKWTELIEFFLDQLDTVAS